MAEQQPQIQVVNKKSGPMANIVAVLYLGGLVVLIGGGFWYGCDMHGDVEAAADTYIEALRQKDHDRAYALLAPYAKANVARADFERKMSTSELSRSSEHDWDRTSSSTNGQACVDGDVTINDEDYSLRIWLRKDGEQWTVHTIYFEKWDYSNVPWRCFSPP